MNLSDFTTLINDHYLKTYNTVLTGGFAEPFYQPAQNNQPAQIQFTQDYFRSALHELAHWCVAGEERKKQDDYGYWYAPDGRSQQQQELFFSCEIVPQAFEWALSLVCGVKFDVSVDNLNNSTSGATEFRQAVSQQLQLYLSQGFPARTEALLQLIYQTRRVDRKNLYRYLIAQLSNDCQSLKDWQS
jgi:elongation factor P hydroxylase